MVMKLWNLLTTDVKKLFASDLTEEGKASLEIFKTGVELAKTLEENKTKLDWLKLIFAQEHVGSLLESLNSPLAQVCASGVPFMKLTLDLIKFYIEKTKKDLTLEECVLVISQAAYLESFIVISNLPEVHKALVKIGNVPASEEIRKQISELAELELSEQDAINVVTCFHKSVLARTFNPLLIARLQQAGLQKDEAKIFADRVAWGTHRHIEKIWELTEDLLKYFGKPSFLAWQKGVSNYVSIDEYLEEIKKQPLEKVFEENFAFNDIYVPLKSQSVDSNGRIEQDNLPEPLEKWAIKLLEDPDRQDRVMFIQADPGRGKSVFCRMFASFVLANLHPVWTPILIRLRDIRTIEKNFEETLRLAVDRRFTKNGWLTDCNTRFLFLLDGFDELLMEGRTSGGLEEFLSQVGSFQESCKQNPEKCHRVMITGRTLSLDPIDRKLPSNLERVEILPMDEELLDQWFAKWELLIGIDKGQAFQNFLKDSRCPERIRELSHEPLLLYLLAAMHRDNELTIDAFEIASGGIAKILIYEKTLDWVLTKQRSKWLNQQLTEMDLSDLRHVFEEAGLCVVQSGGESAKVSMIESRFTTDDRSARVLLDEAKERLGDNPLKNALVAFYLQPKKDQRECGSVEFAHKSFSEFLYAKRLVRRFTSLVQTFPESKKFVIDRDSINWYFYDLLGYGAISLEVVEYVITLLLSQWKNQSERLLLDLFSRLHDFYLCWSNGDYVGGSNQTLAQKKAAQMARYGIELDQQKVNIFTGLNILSILLHFSASIKNSNTSSESIKSSLIFFPCGYPKEIDHDPQRLLKIIGYSHCISTTTFVQVVGKFLSHANLQEVDLNGVDLHGADLHGADLYKAELSRTNMRGANLQGAKMQEALFRGAFLSRADLSKSDLRNSNLRRAYLNRANLQDTNLECADLMGAYLYSVELSGADLRNIPWNSHTKWANAIGLHEINGVPESLSKDSNFRASVQLSHGYSCACQQKIKEAIALYKEAQEIDPNIKVSARFWNKLCWIGVLNKCAKEVLFAGVNATNLEPKSANYRDTLAAAKFMDGDINGAIEDFQEAIRLGFKNPEDEERRKLWLDQLRNGNNPFTQEEIDNLRSLEIPEKEDSESELY